MLPTAGGAEAFTLVARALAPRRAVVVHPQFTEPEAALLAAGHRPERLAAQPRRRLPAAPRAGARGRRPGHGRQPDEPDERPAPGRRPPRARPARPGAGRGRGVHGRGPRRARVADRRRPARRARAPLADQDLGPGRPPRRLRGRRPRARRAPAPRSSRRGRSRPRRSPRPSPAWPRAPVRTPRPRPSASRAGGGSSSTPSPRSASRASRSRAPRSCCSTAAACVPRTGRRPRRVPAGCASRCATRAGPSGAGETFPGLHADWLRVAVRDAETSTAFVAAVERCLS